MRRFRKACLVGLLLGLAAIPATAQGLGHYPVEDLGILDPGTLEVDVNLEGSTLQIAAGAVQDQDPRLQELISSLTRVRVQVGAVEDLDSDVVADRIAGAAAQLESQGWTRIVRVEDGSERVYVYSMDDGDGSIAGITALVNADGEEAVVVNIAGKIDPVLLGSIMSRLGELDFDQFMVTGSDDD